MSVLSKFFGSNSFNVVYIHNGEVDQRTVDSKHPNYSQLKKAVNDGAIEEFLELLNPAKAIETYQENGVTQSSGLVVDDNGNVTYLGEELHHVVVDAIKRTLSEGYSIGHLVKFLENLLQNPSKRSVEQLYKFLEQCKLTITEDGCFLAYKCVRENYFDKHSGKFLNTVGAHMEMPRHQVDDDFRNTCSYGFHVGALAYSGPGGYFWSPQDKVVIVKVNPKDCVSVPEDYTCQKLRTCAYDVVSEYKGELKPAVYSGKVDHDNDDYYEENDDYEDDDYDNYIEDPMDMLIGHQYTFNYTKENGDEGVRHFVLDEIYEDSDRAIGKLAYPEQHVGEIRSFVMSRMEDIYEVE
jgi:hypothetical protein